MSKPITPLRGSLPRCSVVVRPRPRPRPESLPVCRATSRRPNGFPRRRVQRDGGVPLPTAGGGDGTPESTGVGTVGVALGAGRGVGLAGWLLGGTGTVRPWGVCVGTGVGALDGGAEGPPVPWGRGAAGDGRVRGDPPPGAEVARADSGDAPPPPPGRVVPGLRNPAGSPVCLDVLVDVSRGSTSGRAGPPASIVMTVTASNPPPATPSACRTLAMPRLPRRAPWRAAPAAMEKTLAPNPRWCQWCTCEFSGSCGERADSRTGCRAPATSTS